MGKKKVLFVCIHNSARSQMAEAYLNDLAADRFIAESAGLEPGTLNSLVVTVMREDGLDIADKATNSVFNYLKEGREYDYVITVCDEASGQRCPLFPGANAQRLHWGFPDPGAISGSYQEALADIRKIRDAIKQKIVDFING